MEKREQIGQNSMQMLILKFAILCKILYNIYSIFYKFPCNKQKINPKEKGNAEATYCLFGFGGDVGRFDGMQSGRIRIIQNERERG